MPIVDLDQNTDEWKEFRRQKVGASDLPIIMGVSPYSTPLQLWRRKLGFEEEQFMHAGMKFGHDNESKVREMVQIELGMRFDPVVFQHSQNEWAIASLDGYNAENNVIIEIKNCSLKDHKVAKEGLIPEKYIPQVQWQMYCVNTLDAYYCSCHKGDLVIVAVNFNTLFIEKAFGLAYEFHNNLMEYSAPAHSEKDHIEINDPEFSQFAQQWSNAKEVLDEAKRQEEYFKKKLIEFTDDGNAQGFGVRLTRVERKGKVDMEKLCEHFKIVEDDLEMFRKEKIGFWKVSNIITK